MNIVQDGDPVLRKKAPSVPVSAFGTKELSEKLERMIVALDAEANGVALAAPQIGISERIFIVRYDRMEPESSPETPADIGIYINPEIIKTSRRRVEMEEGCLSVSGMFGKTKRFERATVRALDEHGTPFERGAGGILAQAFQHEIDHLDGILFIDHAEEVRAAESRKDYAA